MRFKTLLPTQSSLPHRGHAAHVDHVDHIDRRRRAIVRGAASVPLLATGMFVRPALADATVTRASRRLLGTRVDIVVQDHDHGAVQAAIAAAFAEMMRLEQLMSRYRPDSQISALQRAAGRHPLRVALELMTVLQAAAAVSARSRGAFDITVGAFAGWRFGADGKRVPDAAELARARPLVDYRQVSLDARRGEAMLARPGMRLDLGGIAKLPILDAGMQLLRRHGLANAMVNGGGDVLAMGKLQGRDWRIGVRDPLAPARLLGVLQVSDAVVASSGDYERGFVASGRRYHHVLDPATGLPSAGPHGVTLVAPTVAAVNGLGAALMVAGQAAWDRLAEGSAGVDGLVVGDGGRWMSAGMAQRLRLA
ncbi:Thiamine biosynthesis lipoprotein ApbE [Cupriavidus taiwanensis]|nr:Thiamine biosynthesis lipoprotein ApbE [Cupriavidus taiwanensis]SOY57139.1 Thiamine biosynthesis lipoprotein ApbE [Cupriavidus taiwanensis]SOY79224.1 Thiamine biosynthesis lipoprotein ApbE [Cupriavidus taiwanensis]SOZ65015.1 Thiamine biosynthesis lipoprotein ApbE [Cupriavidus taiwanensis]SOZ76301.1 Thiamine biosynthesis lipoprotein ApbE [Cupriavidus taiwanensis]